MKQCLTFALKFRNTSNFLKFFEIEYNKSSLVKNSAANIREERRPISSSAKKSAIPKLNKTSNFSTPTDFIKVIGKHHHPSQGLYIEEFDTKYNFHNTSAH